MAHTGFKGLTQQIHNIFFIAQDGFGTDCKPQIINKRTLPLFEEHFSVNPLLEPIICIFTNKAKSFLGGGS
jgi:hypothetical protein